MHTHKTHKVKQTHTQLKHILTTYKHILTTYNLGGASFSVDDGIGPFEWPYMSCIGAAPPLSHPTATPSLPPLGMMPTTPRATPLTRAAEAEAGENPCAAHAAPSTPARPKGLVSCERGLVWSVL